MKVLKLLSRILVGLVFIFSGFVKAVDPLGSAYKFHDYFMAFNLQFLDFLTLPLAIILCTTEFIAGFAVLTGVRIKTGIWATILLMVIFTPLTLVLALTNPVSDCGCFGDAIHLTNWQTFGKNLVIIIFAVFLFVKRKSFEPVLNSLTEWIIVSCFVILFVLFNLFNLRYLPVVDFMPYNIGADIPAKMVIPEGVPVDDYKTTFIYEKEGQQKEFTLENYPADDTTWTFVDQVSVLIKKGYQPPVHDFSITSPANDNITDMVLADSGYSLLMISKKLEEADAGKLTKGFETGNYCNGNDISFYILTASGSDEITKYDSDLPFYFSDETTLKTIVRANPGYILLKEGTVIGKWSWATLPEKEWFEGNIAGKQIEQFGNRNSQFIIIIIAISSVIILLLILQYLKQKETLLKSNK